MLDIDESDNEEKISEAGFGDDDSEESEDQDEATDDENEDSKSSESETNDDDEGSNEEDENSSEDESGEGSQEEIDPELQLVSTNLRNIKVVDRIAPSEEKINKGFCFLADLTMDNTLVFCKYDYLLGQTIIVEFLTPNPFSISCKLAYTKNIAMTSRIISENKPKYRLQLDNLLQYPKERTSLRNFLKSIEPDIPVEAPKPVTKKSSEDDELDIDDDLDDFSDFGFDD